MPLRSCSGTFLKPAHRSAPAPAIFDPLRSVFHSAHMLWLDIRGALKFFGRAWSCFRSDRNDGGMVD